MEGLLPILRRVRRPLIQAHAETLKAEKLKGSDEAVDLAELGPPKEETTEDGDGHRPPLQETEDAKVTTQRKSR